jgi:hypothetical protein
MPFPSTRTPEERAQIQKEKFVKSGKHRASQKAAIRKNILEKEEAKLKKEARAKFIEEQKAKAKALQSVQK